MRYMLWLLILIGIVATAQLSPTRECCSAAQTLAPQSSPTLQSQSGDGDAGYQLDDSKGVVIPFVFDPLDRPLITVQASINGSKLYSFIIDTGTTDPLFLCRWAQAELKLPMTGKTIQLHPGNSKAQLTKPVSVAVPGQNGGKALSLSDVTAEIVDMPDSETYFHPHAAGIIGGRLFLLLTSRFDFDKQTITFFDFKHPPVRSVGAYANLPLLDPRAGQPFRVSLSPPGAGPHAFYIDTGDTISYMLAQDAAKLTSLAVRRGSSHTDISGTYSATTVLLPEISIGSLRLKNLPLMVVSRAKSDSLCMDLFSRYRVTIDPSNRIVTFEPRGESEFILRSGDTGVSLDTEGGKTIVAAIATEEAASSGIAVNDRVVSIDGEEAAGMSLPQARRHLNGYEGTTASIVVERQSRKQLTVDILRRSVFSAVVSGGCGVTLLTLPRLAARILEVSAAAEAAGMKVGDEVISINGKTATNETVNQLYAEMSKSRENITFKIQRKGERATVTVSMPGMPVR